jgi:hypothetical protein
VSLTKIDYQCLVLGHMRLNDSKHVWFRSKTRSKQVAPLFPSNAPSCHSKPTHQPSSTNRQTSYSFERTNSLQNRSVCLLAIQVQLASCQIQKRVVRRLNANSIPLLNVLGSIFILHGSNQRSTSHFQDQYQISVRFRTS